MLLFLFMILKCGNPKICECLYPSSHLHELVYTERVKQKKYTAKRSSQRQQLQTKIVFVKDIAKTTEIFYSGYCIFWDFYDSIIKGLAS